MASNTVSTTSTVISDLSNGTNYDGLLKDIYLPGLTDTTYNDPSFSAQIMRSSDQIDYSGQRIKRAFKTQRAGGSGAIAEGGDFVTSVPQAGKQGYEQLKYLNAYFSLTGPTIEAAEQGQGSFVDVVNDSFSDMMTNAQNDFERQIMGAQDGRIAIMQEASSTDETLSVSGDAYFDTQFVMDGQLHEVIDPITATAGEYTTKLWNATDYEFSVASHTQGSKTTGGTSYGTITIDGTATGAGATTYIEISDWLIRANSYKSGLTGSHNCLEINGMQNLISDGSTECGSVIETTNNFLNSWNLSRSTYPYLASAVRNVNAELDEEILLSYLLDAKYQIQMDPNMLLVSPRAILKYFTNTKDDRRFNTMTAMEWVGGYTGLGIQLGEKRLMLASVGSMHNNMGFLMNTADFAFASMTNGYKWLNQGGRILTQKEGSDAQFATAVDYMNFVCNNPRKQMKLYNITV